MLRDMIRDVYFGSLIWIFPSPIPHPGGQKRSVSGSAALVQSWLPSQVAWRNIQRYSLVCIFSCVLAAILILCDHQLFLQNNFAIDAKTLLLRHKHFFYETLSILHLGLFKTWNQCYGSASF